MEKLRLLFYLALTTFSFAETEVKHYELKANLDPFLFLPAAYKKTPEDLPKDFEQGDFKRNPYFDWLTKEQDRAIFKRKPSHNLTVDLTILGEEVPVEEMVIDFKDGKFHGITISIFNRGDGGSLPPGEFKRRSSLIYKHLSEQLKVKPRKRIGNIRKGVMTDGYIWSSARGKAVLEYNPGAPNKNKTEFLRMRLATKEAKGIYLAALQERSKATVRKSELPRNLKKENGNIYIANIPMVDQGMKGYCVVASTQRLFEYYGIACDMHQLAQLAKSDPNAGTNTLLINKQLGAIDYLFKTRFTCLAVGHNGGLVELKDLKYVGDPVPKRSFHKLIEKNIQKGIPLLWSLQLGKFPEMPKANPQASGGHMRMIIGYNEKENTLIFTDSWGAGHEFKTIDTDHAYQATTGLYLMTPTVN